LPEITSGQYDKVRGLFQPPADQPFCLAVLTNVHPGRVFVDNTEQPRTALVTRDDYWCFLGGDPGNDAFNRALNRAIWDREFIAPNASMLLFTCHPQDWRGNLAAVFSPRRPIPARRRHYVCEKSTYDWQSALPLGVALQPMDDSLLRRSDLRIPDEVAQTIRKWRSLARSGARDFGFVAIQESETRRTSEVVSWVTVDAVVEGVGDAGLFTEPRHRRRGLATVTTAAAMEHGLAHGLSAVHWTCAEDNAGSIRIAEKLGFERQPDYLLYYFVLDEAQHLAHLAYHHLEAGRYRETVDLMEQTLALSEDPPFWLYHDAARAWAALAEPARALEALNQAVDRGWTDKEGTRACKEFESLHRLPGWRAVLERMDPSG
jgi:RimJ/RimL family protein N-acetyltransferase